MVRKIKKHIPWYLKIAGKIILARLPLRNHFWHRIGIFRHGDMDTSDYAQEIFFRHYKAVLAETTLPKGYSVLELGPGNSIATGLIAYALGAGRTVLVDTGDYISRDMGMYRALLDSLDGDKQRIERMRSAESFESLCAEAKIEYLSDGLASLRAVKSASIDFLFSNAVLEHVRKHEFEETIMETYRVLKPTGICSHEIDFRDHVGGGLNNLRFSEKLWESSLFTKSGFYTNRLRLQETNKSFQNAHFGVKILSKHNWDEPPIPVNCLHAEFRQTPIQNLMTQVAHVIVRKSKATVC